MAHRLAGAARLLALATLLAATSAAAVPAAAQEWKGAGRIGGKVRDEQSKPIAGAVVKLRHAASNQGPDLKTNKDGDFAVLGIRGGTWNIDIEAPGFLTRKLSVQVPEGEGRVPPINATLERDKALAQAQELQGLLARGDTLFGEGKFAEARAEYEKVLAARPDLAMVHRSIAFTYGREGRHQEALEHLDKALAAAPGDLVMLELAIASAIELGDVARAEGYLASIDVTKLPDSTILENVGVTLLNKNRPAEAVKVLERAIAQFPNAADPYYYRALANLRLGQLDEGKADLEKFVSLAPADSKEAQQAREMLATMK